MSLAATEESILQEAHRLTHGPRRVDYGHPLDDYTRTAALVSAMLAHKLKEPLTAHEMALAMVCVKLSREMNVPKRDNATDGAGYFWVAHACLEEAARRADGPRKVEVEISPVDQGPPRKAPDNVLLCEGGDYRKWMDDTCDCTPCCLARSAGKAATAPG